MEGDRKLLELAAKAAGYQIVGWNEQRGVDVAVMKDGSFWQPLLENHITDCMGDALRLAVKFKMEIDHNHPADQERWVSVRAFPARFACTEDFDDESLREKATRLAILRASIRAAAAAETGRAME